MLFLFQIVQVLQPGTLVMAAFPTLLISSSKRLSPSGKGRQATQLKYGAREWITWQWRLSWLVMSTLSVISLLNH